jgi:hypothetical protein
MNYSEPYHNSTIFKNCSCHCIPARSGELEVRGAIEFSFPSVCRIQRICGNDNERHFNFIDERRATFQGAVSNIISEEKTHSFSLATKMMKEL